METNKTIEKTTTGKRNDIDQTETNNCRDIRTHTNTHTHLYKYTHKHTQDTQRHSVTNTPTVSEWCLALKITQIHKQTVSKDTLQIYVALQTNTHTHTYAHSK